MRKLGGVKRLSLVVPQQDSAATQSAPPAPAKTNGQIKREREAAVKARREESLLRAQETRRQRGAVSRAARAAGEVSRLDKYRAGEYPCHEWEDEEVAKGRPKNLDGSFTGTYPNLTGRQHAEIKRELLKRGQRKMDGLFDVALDALSSIAQYGESEAARVKAADLLVQRVAGKVPDKVEIKSSDPWQDILDEIMDDDVLQRMGVDMPATSEDS